jgi:hypothetical protein
MGWFISSLSCAYPGEHSIVCIARREKGIGKSANLPLLKVDQKASAKQDMPSMNRGAIFFTIEVRVYSLFVEREDRG